MLLTEQEIDDLSREMVKGCKSVNWLARALEAKLLEKLKAQEPFGYFKADAFCWTDCAETDDGAKPLYEHPLPPADVVRDAERYRWLRDQVTHDGIAIVMKNKHIDDRKSYSENIDNFIDAAIKEMK